MPWVEVFAAFLVSHLAGDYLLQTEFQAMNKRGGLGRDPTRRRALASHTLTYGLAYVPALIWLAGELDALEVVAVAAAIAIPHGVQDDGRLIAWWMRLIKHTSVSPGPLAMMVDQSFHVVSLFLVAVIVGL